MVRTATVFGGAGFIGSHICRAFSAAGWKVKAIDGLMPRTFGDAERLSDLPNVEFIRCTTDEAVFPPQLVAGTSVLIDAMGWTRHHEALRDPIYDLRLNVASHLPVIQACAQVRDRPVLIVYLGSRGQYGRSGRDVIEEDSPMDPVDVQGIHKLAAEKHWQSLAPSGGTIISLRFGNTYGPGQPLSEGDIGLIGGFIRSALKGETIAVYSPGRRRDIVYAPDLAGIVVRLAEARIPAGFTALNVTGLDASIGDLADAVVRACGRGCWVEEPMPPEVRRLDAGDAVLSTRRLQSFVKVIPLTPLSDGLTETLHSLRHRTCRAPGS